MNTECQGGQCSCGTDDVSEVEQFAQLDEIISDYKDKPGGLIPVLQIAQGIFGYLSENVLRHISLKLDKPFSEVSGVVSFYTYFSTHPRGENLVRVCLGTACYVRGGKEVLEAIKKELEIDVGETTSDKRFSLEIARCFGACSLAPAISVNDDVYQQVKAARVGQILELYKNGSAQREGSKGSEEG